MSAQTPLPGKSFESGPWSLDIFLRAKSSRSEGSHGVLYHQGNVVEPQEVAQVIEIDLGAMKYCRHPADMTYTFEYTGWNSANPDRGV